MRKIGMSSDHNKSQRVNLVLPMITINRIDRLKDMTSATTTTEVIRSAILSYEALVEHISDGYKFYICKPGEERYHPVNFIFDVLPKEAVV
jgi:hypothetical protein